MKHLLTKLLSVVLLFSSYPDIASASQWDKTIYGISGPAKSMEQTSDGGFIVTGGVYSVDFGSTTDFRVVKLHSDGSIAWQKTYGGAGNNISSSILQTSEGGYIVASETYPEHHPPLLWILKIDKDGSGQWQKTYAGGRPNSILQAPDGGYIAAGGTFSFGSGAEDAWVLKLDKDGTIQWQKTYGGTNYEEANAIRQTRDGGYIVAGFTESFGPGDRNAWVLKLKSNGDVIWQQTYAKIYINYGEISSIQETPDGGYIAAGSSWFLLKLDSHGDIPGCSLIESSYATTMETDVIGKDTSVTGAASTIVPEISNITSKDTSAVEYTLCLSPKNQNITLNPAEIFFSPILVGQSADEAVTVINEGNADITMDLITPPYSFYSSFSIQEDNCSGQTLGPLGRCTITVRFSPTYAEAFYGILNIPLKDSYESLFTVFLFGKPSITLSTPLNNASFNACSLYSPSTFAWKVGQEFDNNEVQIFLEQHYQHFVVNVPGTSTETVIPSPMWKRILSILGNPGGRLKWEVFGCRVKTGCISVSEYRIISIEASQPIQNPKISPTSKNPIPTLSWQGNCNTKFKVWFGNDGNFSKKTTYTFTIKNPNDNGGDFLKTVTPSQWKSIRRLVGDGTGSTIYWYVESWDGVGRYSKTNVMSFVLTE